MKRPSLFFLILAVLCVLPFPTTGLPVLQSSALVSPFVTSTSTGAAPAVEPAFGQFPLYFVVNNGQVDPRVGFYIQGRDKTIYFSPEGVTFALTNVELKIG